MSAIKAPDATASSLYRTEDAARLRRPKPFEEDFFVLDTGRDEEEQFVTLVQDGDYQGFGYISKEETNSIEDLFECIKSYPNNPENKRIIARYLADKGNVKVVN